MMQWDSAAPVGTHSPTSFSFHSAFEVPRGSIHGDAVLTCVRVFFQDPNSKPDAPDRESIECRCIVIF